LQDPSFSTDGSGDLVQFSNTRDRRISPVLLQIQPDGAGSYKFVYLP
jgi:hypothetical protein